MAEDSLVQLLVRLSDRTRAGELAWEEMSTHDAFAVSFPKYTVQIVRNLHFAADDSFDLRIYDLDDELVDEASDEELQRMTKQHEMKEVMSELYANARRKAKGARDAVRSILDELDGG